MSAVEWLKQKRLVIVSIFPTVTASVLFYFLLGHRRDYLGHYAAGFGATAIVNALALAITPASKFERLGPILVVCATIVCILLGTITEASLFRIAKFDEIDYCNQNIGAVLAGLVALNFAGKQKPADTAFRCLIATGAIWTMIGGHFAFT